MVIWPNSAGLIFLNTVCIVCILMKSTALVEATVLEYSNDGTVSVNESKKSGQTIIRVEKTSGSSNELRSLTRNIALQFSGAIGVRKAGLDALTFVEVFETLIQRESAFDPKAISAKGAKGLGQLMPETAKDLGVSDPFDPKANLTGSAKYFTKMLLQFGSLELALAAYNAGPDRVRQYKGVPPFEETKAYIAWIYKHAGLKAKTSEPVKATPASVPVITEKPLNGDVSVWEF